MSVQTEQMVWVVSELKDDGSIVTSVYDNEADAQNYAIEMRARYEDKKKVRIQQTVLNRRDEVIESDDSPWGALRLDVRSEFVEGLMEDMVPLDQIRPGAAERFVCEKIPMVRRRALEKFEEILKNETLDELNVCHDEWCGHADMED